MPDTMIERLARKWAHGEEPNKMEMDTARFFLRAIADEVEAGQNKEVGWSEWSNATILPHRLRTEADRT